MVIKKILISTTEPDDLRVLNDVLRAHFPESAIADMSDNQIISGENESEEGVIRLYIEWLSFQQGLRARLVYRRKEYSQAENVSAQGFQEEPTNQRRRLLRLAVYRLIAVASKNENEIARPSTWGILTGVRPTKIVHRLFEQGFSEDRVIHHLTNDYGISAEKARLVINVALIQKPYLSGQDCMRNPAADTAPNMVSVYIGIPFCPTRCHYCSFPSFSLERHGHRVTEYLHVLYGEMKSVGLALKKMGILVQTVYIGGGTPTSISAGQLDELLARVDSSFLFAQGREFTVEGGRPDTLDEEKFQVMKNHGVSRISINPQTMHEPTLVTVGRKHTPQEVIDKFQLAGKIGFPVVNMDLIVGLPGEDTEILRETLEAVIDLRPENITLHALAIKRAAYYGQAAVILPGQNEGENLMTLAHSTLQRHGYIPYYLYRQKEILAHSENVGYMLPGFPCIYNIQMIEERQTILGFGVGAGSKFVRPKERSLENIYNPKDLDVYFQRIEEIIATKVDKLAAFVYNCL